MISTSVLSSVLSSLLLSYLVNSYNESSFKLIGSEIRRTAIKAVNLISLTKDGRWAKYLGLRRGERPGDLNDIAIRSEGVHLEIKRLYFLNYICAYIKFSQYLYLMKKMRSSTRKYLSDTEAYDSTKQIKKAPRSSISLLKALDLRIPFRQFPEKLIQRFFSPTTCDREICEMALLFKRLIVDY